VRGREALAVSDRRVIFTADDFGLAAVVNEAVERAHREGVLGGASLMVAAPATADAVERARRLPTLRVGLHVVLVNGRPALPPERVADLVDENGFFPSDLVRAGFHYATNRAARRQLRAEIRAQFEAFRATGLELDHVNAQNHFHVHPLIFGMILDIGRDYGLRAIRIPREPFLASWRAERTHLAARVANEAFIAPWLALMRRRARRAGLACNDFVFGMNDTGQMTSDRVQRLMRGLPRGVTELYFHPAMSAWDDGMAAMPGYAFAGEFAALVDPAVAAAARAAGVERVTFSQLAAERA
jgi:hopanoid biosynthesis associated protein HpnK